MPIPASVLADPVMRAEIDKALTKEAMVWCWGFWAMAIVSVPAPAYVDFFGGKIELALAMVYMSGV